MFLLNPWLNVQSMLAFFGIIYRQRELTIEMTRREFSEKYAGQALGVLWGIFHPVAIIGVYIFIFGIVLPFKSGGAVNPEIGMMLAGLVPWMAMAETLNRGTQVISGNANLVKQVIFPLEVLPAKTVAATSVNLLILLAGVLLFVGFTKGFAWTIGLVPALLALQFIQMLGMSMLLSAVGVFLRDLKDVIAVFCLVNIYLMPVIFAADFYPASIRWLIYVNPFTYQTLCYQEAIDVGAITPWVWLIYATLSILTLAVGYRVFTKLRPSLGNVL